jgi:ArsR family transcriptional regulator
MNGIYLLKCICDETRFEILEMLQKKSELCVKSREEGKKSMYSISSNELSELLTNVTKASKKIPVLCSDDNCC